METSLGPVWKAQATLHKYLTVASQPGRIIQPSSHYGPAGAFFLAGVELLVRPAPHEAMKAGYRLHAAASGRARYYVLWLGTLAGGEIVTARPRSSCGGRLIAAPVTRPSSVPAARRFLLPEPSLSSASSGQGPAAPGGRLSPDCQHTDRSQDPLRPLRAPLPQRIYNK